MRKPNVFMAFTFLAVSLIFGEVDAALAVTPPTAQSPANESSVKALAPTLVWEPSPQGGWYFAEIASSPEIDPNSAQGSFLSSNIVAFTAGRLSAVTSWTAPALPSGTYYWHVLAGEAGTNIPSPFTPVWKFTLDSAPALIYPASNAVATSSSPVFSWEPLASSPRYLVEISREPTFDLDLYGNVILARIAGATTYNPGNKLTHGKYWWRVRGETGEGPDCGQGTMRCGSFSQAAEFLIDGTPPSVSAGPPKQGIVGQPLTIEGSAQDSSSGVDPASIHWRFGDGGEAGNQLVVQHTYTASGSYQVSLTVKDLAGHQSVAYATVTVAGLQAAEAQPKAPPLSPFTSVWMYPNPFYPGQDAFFVQKDTGKRVSLRATSFCFNLNTTGHVYVSLFNSKGFLGRMYAKPYFINNRMFNRYLGPGRYYVGWTGTLNGKLLPPGTYKYVLTASNGSVARTYQGTVTLRQFTS